MTGPIQPHSIALPKRLPNNCDARPGALPTDCVGVIKFTNFSCTWYRSLRPLDARRSMALRFFGPCTVASSV